MPRDTRRDEILFIEIAVLVPVAFGKRGVVVDAVDVLACGEDMDEIGGVESQNGVRREWHFRF